MLRDECGACGGPDLRVFLDLGKTPLANSFPATVDEAETWYPLQLARCGSCGLVQQTEVIPDADIYGPGYGFYSGGSPAQRAYHAAGAAMLMDRYPGLCRKGVLEVACNDGSMLGHFAGRGYDALGVDPAAGPVAKAAEAGLNVLGQPFTADLARHLRDDRGTFGLVIAYNSMAHINDLGDVLTGMREVMAPASLAVVEVQYLPDLLAGNLIGQVYHEHRYFHSVSSFQRMARLHGLYLVGAELIELQGGGMRLYLATTPANAGEARAVQTILTSERWLNRDATYDGMQGRVDRNRDHLLALVDAERKAGRDVVGYAAAAKATTILNYCGLGRDMIPYVIDTTEYKWGRYVPGVKTRIVAPDSVEADVADTRLLLTSNYLGSVLRNDRAFLDKGGRWVLAEPFPTVV
jgi:SAM-dependent methyltransferase